MARDKRTARAEARRRHREQLRAQQAAGPAPVPAEEPPADEPRSLVATIASGFTVPDVGGDLRALPSVALRTYAFLVPLVTIAGAFVVGLDRAAFRLESAPGEPLTSTVGRYFYQFALQPPSVTAVFLGGVLAPRASWLVGGIVGLLSTAVFLVLLGIHGPTAYFSAALSPAVAAETFVVYVPLYLILGGFAGWYRRWLLSRQRRSRQVAEERRRARSREARRAKTAAARR